MKKILVILLLLFCFSAFSQSKPDTLIDQQVQPTSGNYPTKKALNPVLHEMLGNRVTNYGNASIADEIITFTGLKAKFGASAELGPLSGSDTLVAPDADPLKFRIDYLVVNRDGTTEIITGQPGIQGLSPAWDVANQVPAYSILVNDRGVGTIEPVTYATLTEVRAGILSNVALSPSTYMTVTQEMIDEALAGIMLTGGHTLKYNGTAITQRGTLRVLQDSDVLPANSLRDSSDITESILDLRPYLSRFGTATGYPISGYFNTDRYGTSFVTPTSSDANAWRGSLGIGQTTATIQTFGVHSGVNILADNEFGSSANWIPLRIIASRRDTIGGVWPTTSTTMGLYWDFTPSYNQIRFGTQSYSGGIGPPFRGLVYDLDYSANFTSRSLVDKGYVDAAIAAGGGGGISDAPSDGNNYGRNNGAWTDLSSIYLTPTQLQNTGWTFTDYQYHTNTFSIWTDGATNALQLDVNGIVRAYGGSAGHTIGFLTPTANRTINFPDKDGTVALLSDIGGGGSGGDADSLGSVPASGYVLKADVDAIPTNGSTDPVSSDGAYDALVGKANALGNYSSNSSAYVNGDDLQTFANKTKTQLESTADFSTGTIAGDVTGTAGATTVAKIQGTPVQAITPTNGQILQYNSASSRYEPSILSSVDATAVHMAGTETITGLKTFSAKPTSTAGLDVSGNNSIAQSNSGKATPTWTRILNFSPNTSQDQGQFSLNTYNNAGTQTRDYTTLGAARVNLNAGNANNLNSVTLVLTNTSGTDVSGIRTLMASGGSTVTNNFNNLNFFGDVSTTPTAFVHAAPSTTASASLRIPTGTAPTSPNEGDVWQNSNNLLFRTNSTTYTVDKVLKGSATLDFPSTAAQTSSELTITVTGAADGDVVALGIPNASSNANSCFTARVSAANTVTIKLNNYSTGAIDPASGTFNVAVSK